MKVEVFDDSWSLLHLILGGITTFFPLFFVVYVFYEFTEFVVKHPKERFEFFIGDILEFSLGVTLTTIIL